MVRSEFLLACDVRFASREYAVLGQPEVGFGAPPGAGGVQRLARLVVATVLAAVVARTVIDTLGVRHLADHPRAH